MDAEILKPKELEGIIYFKEDTLDLILQIISVENDKVIVKIIFNQNQYFRDEVGKEISVSLESLRKTLEENHFKELTDYDNELKILKQKYDFIRYIRKLRPKKAKILSAMENEKKEWDVTPNPGNSLKRYSENDDAILRLMSLMELPHENIRNILIDMLDEKYYDIIAKGTCKKEYSNDKPTEVTFSDYDSIIINWTGIYYKPEHGNQVKLFDGFTIEAIIKHLSDLDFWTKE